MVKTVSCSATSSFAGCISRRRLAYVRLGLWCCIKYRFGARSPQGLP